MDTLAALLEDELKDIYSAEHQLTKALPMMAKKASSDSLKAAFTSHLRETQNQIRRLEEIGHELKIKLTGKTCHAMEGLVEEGKEVLNDGGKGAVIDAALIGGAASRALRNGSLWHRAAMAEALSQNKVASLLQQTLDEEGAADKNLTSIAESEILTAALANGGAAMQ